ncbi:hypothetical protein AMECASPLE_023843 [Ameca splendens]|uniref:Uncharacterized protein n=1 Tax=Ameca splendens TaxID=208324 RepID=A0ABV1A0Y9_9TELE
MQKWLEYMEFRAWLQPVDAATATTTNSTTTAAVSTTTTSVGKSHGLRASFGSNVCILPCSTTHTHLTKVYLSCSRQSFQIQKWRNHSPVEKTKLAKF